MSSGASDRDEAPVTVGQLVCDRFEIRERRAPGGTAVTFAAHDILTDQLVALKVARGATPGDKKLFLDQAAKITRLHSAWLPAYLGYFEHAAGDLRFPALCLELVQGEALGTYLAGSNEAECLQVLRQLALELDELDQVEMRHGDLTTQNVLVREGVPILIDPDSAGKASEGVRYVGSDFDRFAAIVRKSKVAVSFPDITAALGRLDGTFRPFLAASHILTEQLRPELARQPSLRLRAVREAYRNTFAEAEARYANLLRARRSSFDHLAAVIDDDCRVVGLEVELPDREQEERDRAEEMSHLAKAAGLLKAAQRTFRSREGHKWTLQLMPKSGFRLPRPYPPDPNVCGQISSAVHTLEDLALIEEQLRIRINTDGRPICELGSFDGWVSLPDGWSTRVIEVLAGERVPALPTGYLVPGETQSEMPARSAREVYASIMAELNDRDSSALAVRFRELIGIPRADWPEALATIFRDPFLACFGSALRHVERFDVVRIDGCWHLDIVARTRTEEPQTTWIVPLSWLTPTERELHA